MRPSSFIFLLGFLLLFSGCVQPQNESPGVLPVNATGEWVPDGIVGEGEYPASTSLRGGGQGMAGGEMTIFWRTDAEKICMALNGSTEGWVAVGFEPSVWMADCDMVAGYVHNGVAEIRDEYSTGNYGPHEDDVSLGGTDDIIEFGGREDGGYTTIEFSRKLDTGDRYDRALAPGDTIPIIWGTATTDSLDAKHDIAYGDGAIVLGAAVEPVGGMKPLSSVEAEDIILIREEEKLGRDIYLDLFEAHALPIFEEVARSEENHMASMKSLIDAYGLDDPVIDELGAFEAADARAVYADLTAKGRESAEAGLSAGAEYEEVNIIHLMDALGRAGHEDIKSTYSALIEGSKKHLRLYVGALGEGGYSPRHLSQDDYRDIIDG